MNSDELALHKQFVGRAFEPRAVEFFTKPGKSCRHCIFNGQRHEVCDLAVKEAALRGIDHCELGVVYVLKKRDPRQLTIE